MFDKKYVKHFKNFSYDKDETVEHLYEYNSPELKILVAIDNVRYKVAIGGCRFINETPRNEAIKDVCKLSKAMTKKNIISDIKYDGGKAFIYYCSINRNEMLKIYSAFLNYLNGIYQTADDINTTVYDMKYMRQYTKHARGYMIDNYQIPATSYGVYLCIKASVKAIFNKNSLQDLKIAIQGIGKVGYNLALLLSKEGCKLYIDEIDYKKIDELSKQINFTLINGEFVESDVDILSPCALGGIINHNNVKNIRAKLIIGGANNQLVSDDIDKDLFRNGITYIPDVLANCGGVIDLDCEGNNYSVSYVYKRLNLIYTRTFNLINTSYKNNISVLNCVNDFIEDQLFRIKA